MRKLTAMIMALALVLTVFAAYGSSGALAAASEVSVTIDGVKQNYKQPAVLYKGSVLVPLRPIFEALGAGVHWNANDKIVTAYKGDQVVSLMIGDMYARIGDGYMELNQPAQIMNGNTLVPVRFVSEGLGAEVKWNSATKTVEIKKRDESPDKQVYGYTMNVTQTILDNVEAYYVSHPGNLASSTPLLGGREFSYVIKGLLSEDINYPLFSIKTFNGDKDQFAAANDEDYTYLATANGITFAYRMYADSADEVRDAILSDVNIYGEELPDADYKIVSDVFAELPGILKSFQITTQKPAASTVVSAKDYEGAWKSADGEQLSFTFITSNEAVLKYSDFVDKVVTFYSDGSLNEQIYPGAFVQTEDGKVTLFKPIIYSDGMMSGEYETISFTKS